MDAPAGNRDGQGTAQRLTEAFGTPFNVTTIPDLSGRTLRPIIQHLTVSKHRLVIPIGKRADSPAVAVGTLDAQPTEMAERLLEVAVRYIQKTLESDEQLLDLEACTRQISQDFDERNWLLGQLRRLREWDTRVPVSDFAEGVLQSLARTVRAEDVMLVAAEGEEAPSARELPPVGKTVIRSGTESGVINNEACVQLVGRLREVAEMDPLVQNEMKRRREFSMAPGVHSCILTPVKKRGAFFGWILAVNRIPEKNAAATAASSADDAVTGDEFGTAEAQLTECAAAILALHPHCEELLAG
jgi:hypothetical protein